IVGYGTGVIQGTVSITGALPAGTRLMVTARQTNSQSSTNQNRTAMVDNNRGFRIEGLLSGSYELRLTAMGGGGGRGGGRGAGGGGGSSQSQISSAPQTVNVINGQVTPAVLNLVVPQQ